MINNNQQFLTDIYLGVKSNREIAEKYTKALGYIKLLREKIKKLQHSPVLKDNKIVCALCGKEYELHLHHNHNTGRYITIVCHGCNKRLGQTHDLTFKKHCYLPGQYDFYY